jgi:tetratricopeptide (TPR) repeat protein
MRVLARFFVIATALFSVMTLMNLGQSRAQSPDDEKPKNLKVLPKSWSHSQVVAAMRSISGALGVGCDECHVKKAGSDEMDFAADKKPEKETARKMMKMTTSINEQLGAMKLEDSLQVGCVTCHHGVKHPQTLNQVLMKSVGSKGVDATIQNYRALRDKYYGTAAYDFSPQTLNSVATSLAENKDFEGATKMVNLNLEFTPNNAYTYVTMGQIQLGKGDKPAAIASFQKALELDPNNRYAKRLLEQTQGGK